MEIKEECLDKTDARKIKLEDFGRKVIFCNESREDYIKVRADGCLVKNALCADWILSKPGAGDIVVELKGSDVAHALRQIEATLILLKTANYSNGRFGGLIVCSRVPKIDTVIQRARLAFATRFRAALKISSSSKEFGFYQVLRM